MRFNQPTKNMKNSISKVCNCQKATSYVATRYVTTGENSCPMACFHINKMITTISYGYTLNQALAKVIQTKEFHKIWLTLTTFCW
jgi:hypothetical protein